MSLTKPQVTRLRNLIETYANACSDRAGSRGMSGDEQADCRVWAKKAETQLYKYIDGLASKKKGPPA